ncbi:MAG: PqqD family protein [Lachnospiraceae bacterium]|nr:PqqD family protein [Lachnospiraceae bacterium]
MDIMYKISNSDFGWNNYGDQFVLYNHKKECYYVLNETAKDLWDIIVAEAECTVDVIVRKMADIYDTDVTDLRKDVLVFVERLLEIGALSKC